MTKKYLMRRTIETEILFEGTEEEIRDQYCEYIRGYKTLDGDEVKVELLDEVDQYMETFDATYCREDLENVLADKGVPPTEENLKKFMKLNPRMEGFREMLIEDWFERMGNLIWPEKDLYSQNNCIERRLIDDVTKVEICEQYDNGEREYVDDINPAYFVAINGEVYSNFLTKREAYRWLEGAEAGRKVVDLLEREVEI